MSSSMVSVRIPTLRKIFPGVLQHDQNHPVFLWGGDLSHSNFLLNSLGWPWNYHAIKLLSRLGIPSSWHVIVIFVFEGNTLKPSIPVPNDHKLIFSSQMSLSYASLNNLVATQVLTHPLLWYPSLWTPNAEFLAEPKPLTWSCDHKIFQVWSPNYEIF